MALIVSKKHPVTFYGLILLLSISALALLAGNIFVILEYIDREKALIFKDYLGIILLIFFLIFSLTSIFSYWNAAPKLVLTDESITIGDNNIPYIEIEQIILDEKIPFTMVFMTTSYVNGIALQLKNEGIFLLYDQMYENSADIKLMLEQRVVQKELQSPLQIEEPDIEVIDIADEIPFKGKQLASVIGLSFWGLPAVFIYLGITSAEKDHFVEATTFMIFVLIFWFYINGNQMHYFGLTKDYLIIRNHIFFWKLKVYRLIDLKQVYIESGNSSLSTGLRVITKDFGNHIYRAGTLYNKTWLKLIQKLESQGIVVENECIF